jgi:hypothetical protein
MFQRLHLRTLLTLPYVLLMLALALAIGGLSYAAGRNAVDELSGQLLREMVDRIALATQLHVSNSRAVLDGAFPPGVVAPDDFDAAALAALRARFWSATSIHRNPNNDAFYGDREGRFYGLYRHSLTEGEIRLRGRGEGARSILRFAGIDGPSKPKLVEARIFEPRERPWFTAARNAAGHVTDHLTGLRNREALMRAIGSVDAKQPHAR